MAVDPARAKSLFLAASDMPDLAQRADFLGRECGGDAALRARVDALLRANDAAPLPPIAAADATRTHGPEVQAETENHINSTTYVGAILAGKYKLIEEIGEGGMGSVFMAQQTEPVKRAVAVKVIKAGMDSKAVLARFEAERQALAMMDHPNIAKVLDGGIVHEQAQGRTSLGFRPFFVMELVKGVPITQYCDERKLTPRQRLELFVPVCNAIQHAHQKGIIHRDIKPSNVLVALYDDRPVPKVIDFGIAKAAGQTLTDKTLMTGFGAVVGTPEYMSPEQASLNNLDIDTRSDVYSLGVLLYELLTGSTPVDRKSLGKAALLEVLRIVREVEAPRPSAKLSTSDARASISANRGTEPAKLSKLMKGELDWLLLKALEKDRTRRYDTANGLARDIQRYLADEIVEARPPSTGYRLRKFVRRHKGQVIAASLVLFALLAGIAGTTIGLIGAKRAAEAERIAKDDAEEQKRLALRSAESEADERRKADAAKIEAQTKAAEANAVVKFFEEQVFAAARPKNQDGGLGAGVTLRDAIASSEPALDRSFTAQPLVEARLRMALGNTFSYLAEHEHSQRQFERARSLFSRNLAPDHPTTLASMNNLAVCYAVTNRPTEALALRKEVLAIQKRVLPEDHPDTLKSMHNLGSSFLDLNRPAEALKLFGEVLEIQKRVLPKDHPDTLTCMSSLALGYEDLNRLAEALALREEVLAIQKRVLPPEHPDTLKSMHNLALSYADMNRQDEALKLREEVLAIRKRVLPKDHPDTLTSMNNLALSYADLNRQAEALALREEVLVIRKRVLPQDDPDTLKSMGNLANSYAALKRQDEALKLREEVLAIQKRVLPHDHIDTLRSIGNLANSYMALNRTAEALKLFEELLAIQKRVLPKDHLDTIRSMGNLADCYDAVDRHADALKLGEEALALKKSRFGTDNLETLGSQTNLAVRYREAKRESDALPLLEDSFARKLKALPANHYFLFVAAIHLAECYEALDRGADAIAVVDQYLKHLAQGEGIKPEWIDEILGVRILAASKAGDPAACRATAEMGEKRNRPDADSLYTAARFRAVTAGIQAKAPGADAARLAKDDADRAMQWLHKAVTAGWNDAAHAKKDTDLDVLRQREDYKKLIAELEKKAEKK